MLYRTQTLAKLSCCAFCCLAAAVHAAPPPGTSGGGMLQRASGLLAAQPSRSPASRLDLQRLDLRAPENPPAERAPMAMDSASAFPSAKHPRIASDSRAQEDPPALGGGAAIHTLSRAQEMAQRVQREGLPVARLWETRSALLHIGLSPHGKPGLWLIQKVP
jgi:hypothetical protein